MSDFDRDLREGKAREDALVHVMLRSRVEVKSDRRCADTGNLCIEFAQSDGKGGLKPSGIAASGAERWAFEYGPECWLILPKDVVLLQARRAYREGRVKPTGDNGNVSVLVPIDRFVPGPNEVEGQVAA